MHIHWVDRKIREEIEKEYMIFLEYNQKLLQENIPSITYGRFVDLEAKQRVSQGVKEEHLEEAIRQDPTA